MVERDLGGERSVAEENIATVAKAGPEGLCVNLLARYSAATLSYCIGKFACAAILFSPA